MNRTSPAPPQRRPATPARCAGPPSQTCSPARPGPGPERPTSWQTFLRAHWGAIAGADFFTTEVWTAQGLVTYYTLFVIDLASRRVQILGSTRHPDALFMHQITRALIFADDGALACHRVLICDRDAKWSHAVRDQLTDAGLRVVQTPYRAPNANAHAERFVRSIKEECLQPRQPRQPRGRITRRPRLGGLLNFYVRAA